MAPIAVSHIRGSSNLIAGSLLTLIVISLILLLNTNSRLACGFDPINLQIKSFV